MTTRPTIRDVAQAAGVSVTTVSHALNGKGRVDPVTRDLVAQVGRDLGYRANRHARGLRSGRSGALALLLPVRADGRTDEALSLDFYMRLASAAAAAAFAQDEVLMLLPPTITGDGLRGLALDGGIVVDPSPVDPRASMLTEQGLPVVTIERDLGRPEDRWYVASETDMNTRRILNHLAAQGAQRIAMLVPRTDWGWATESRGAYESWVREHGRPRLAIPVAMAPGEESAYLATQRLLARRQPPDAVFVVAARFIRGVMRAASEAGCQVPGDLLVAAGVDSVQAREAEPPVTALDLHPDRQAEAAVEMLLARIDGGEVPAPRYIPATLRLRVSTGMPRPAVGAEPGRG